MNIINDPSFQQSALGIVVPFVSALLRNSHWSSLNKAIFQKIICLFLGTLAANANGTLSHPDGWKYVGLTFVSALAVEPSLRTNVLKQLDDWSTSIVDKLKVPQNTSVPQDILDKATAYDKIMETVKLKDN